MLFRVLTSKSGSNNAAKSGLPEAREMQSDAEHERLLDITQHPRYSQIMALPNGPAKMMMYKALEAEVKANEKANPKYWKTESEPRRYLSHSSSWVGNVNYDPYSKIMTVDLGGKQYSYPNVEPDGVARLLNSGSLGKFLNRVKPYVGQGF